MQSFAFTRDWYPLELKIVFFNYELIKHRRKARDRTVSTERNSYALNLLPDTSAKRLANVPCIKFSYKVTTLQIFSDMDIFTVMVSPRPKEQVSFVYVHLNLVCKRFTLVFAKLATTMCSIVHLDHLPVVGCLE